MSAMASRPPSRSGARVQHLQHGVEQAAGVRGCDEGVIEHAQGGKDQAVAIVMASPELALKGIEEATSELVICGGQVW